MAMPWMGYQTGQYDQAVDYSFDPNNFYSPSETKKTRSSNIDPLSGIQFAQVATQAAPGLFGALTELIGYGARRARYHKFEKQAEEILSRTPGYEIPKESLELLATSQEGAEKVRQYSGEALDLAKEATAQQKMPGYDVIKEDILAGQAQNTQEAVQQGGIESLGSIANIQQKTNDSLKNLAFENIKYRSQAQDEYRRTLANRSQAELAAFGLETKGLSEMAAQREQQYQIEVLDPHYNKLQFDISQIGNRMAMAQGPDVAGAFAGLLGFGLNVASGVASLGATTAASGAASAGGLGSGII